MSFMSKLFGKKSEAMEQKKTPTTQEDYSETAQPVPQTDEEVITQMLQAIRNGNLETVKCLLDANDGLLETSTVFGTWLHYAASHGKYDIAKYLVERGIDVNKEGGVRKCGALTDAAFKGYCNIVELLYTHGANLDVSCFESNPLFAAIYNGHMDVVRFLVENGIDITLKYPIGKLDQCDAYEYARQYGRTQIADYLKEKDAY